MGPSGVLVIDKPPRMSSMDVVASVRHNIGRGKSYKVGHAGTLDPLATGVLVIAVGAATRSIDRIMATDKRYETTIDLTAFTTTDDLEGVRTEVSVNQPPGESAVINVLGHFTGKFEQCPPAFSAVKINGHRSYKLARQGRPVAPPSRAVCVHSLDLIRYEWPMLELRIHCAKGFYVRSLARDLGQALGSGGHCTAIRRTAVGPFSIEMARRLDELPTRVAQADLIPIEAAVALVNA